MTTPALTATGLSATATLTRHGHRDRLTIIDGVDLTLHPGTVTALVGESGCGKSIIARTLIGLPPAGVDVNGTIDVNGTRLHPNRPAGWRAIRGHHLGYVPQSVAGAFTASHTVGRQLDQARRAVAATPTVSDLCTTVGLDAAALELYPHELSGGMLQRAAIAAAITGNPGVLIADEPTSALDPDLAAHTWTLLTDLAATGTAILVITHDMQSMHRSGAVDTVLVMRDGTVIADTTPAALDDTTDHYLRTFGKAPAWN